jgi:DNA polymerase III alpha subunit
MVRSPGRDDAIHRPYIAGKTGKERYLRSSLVENALKGTYGVTIYQEQVMQISRELGGLSGGEADTLRKAMGKKNVDLMMKFQEKIVEGGAKNGVPATVIDKIWQDWLKFAEYAFNKSHATCYALVAYQTAWLKAHYPVEFMAALLSLEDDPSAIPVKIEVCKNMGINIIPPNINRSDAESRTRRKALWHQGDQEPREPLSRHHRRPPREWRLQYLHFSSRWIACVNKTVLKPDCSGV